MEDKIELVKFENNVFLFFHHRENALCDFKPQSAYGKSRQDA